MLKPFFLEKNKKYISKCHLLSVNNMSDHGVCDIQHAFNILHCKMRCCLQHLGFANDIGQSLTSAMPIILHRVPLALLVMTVIFIHK